MNSKINEKKIISDIRKSLLKSKINEAYVSEPKPYKQVSDMVSQRTKDAHTELYNGYIKASNNISSKLDSIDKTNVCSENSEYRSAKIDEAYNLNAKWLHELFFANCFDTQSEIYGDSKSFIRLNDEWGDFTRWQKDFIASAMAAREGWVVCGYHMHLRKYINTIIDSHSQNVLFGVYPLIVLDMWSHAYFRDYTIDKSSYIVAMMREFNWRVIEDRFEIVEKLGDALK